MSPPPHPANSTTWATCHRTQKIVLSCNAMVIVCPCQYFCTSYATHDWKIWFACSWSQALKHAAMFSTPMLHCLCRKTYLLFRDSILLWLHLRPIGNALPLWWSSKTLGNEFSAHRRFGLLQVCGVKTVPFWLWSCRERGETQLLMSTSAMWVDFSWNRLVRLDSIYPRC